MMKIKRAAPTDRREADAGTRHIYRRTDSDRPAPGCSDATLAALKPYSRELERELREAHEWLDAEDFAKAEPLIYRRFEIAIHAQTLVSQRLVGVRK